MKNQNENIVPFVATHPGEILADELEARGLTEKELATQLKVTDAYLELILKGQNEVTEEFAFRLEKVLGIPVQFWLAMQENYYEDTRQIEAKTYQLTHNTVTHT